MIEVIKKRLIDELKKKHVSLAFIFDREGRILWHKKNEGRRFSGNNISQGEGFCKNLLFKCLNGPKLIKGSNEAIKIYGEDLSQSARRLLLKSVIIQPLDNVYFLYIDSGSEEFFNAAEQVTLKVLGNLLKDSIQIIRKKEKDIGGISGKSKKIKEIRDTVLKYAIEEESVLLLGETGVGKTHIAELIHIYSGREGNFITVNTPGIPDTLFESEIFGHQKGAFTDARADKKGLISEANGGTLFFDEISETPISFQAKLLSFVDTKKYRVLGDSKERMADVRIIAATNLDLKKAINDKQFRNDLYYRLRTLEITIPPLRERKEDIEAIIHENKELLKNKRIGDGFWEVLYQHDWPGNIRELLSTLTRARIHCKNLVTGSEIQKIINEDRTVRPLNIEKNKIDFCWKELESGKTFWDVVWKSFISRDIDRDVAKGVLHKAYINSSCIFKRMIKILNIPENDYHKFMTLMHHYHLDPRS